jgi:hypothetical protein
MPCRSHSTKSSSPNAIAVCTRPVPLSSTTCSAASTVWPFGPWSGSRSNGGAYLVSTIALPGKRSSTAAASPRMSSTRSSATTTTSLPTRARTYMSDGEIATAQLANSVHGCVVQISSASPACSGPRGSITGSRTVAVTSSVSA